MKCRVRDIWEQGSRGAGKEESGRVGRQEVGQQGSGAGDHENLWKTETKEDLFSELKKMDDNINKKQTDEEA